MSKSLDWHLFPQIVGPPAWPQLTYAVLTPEGWAFLTTNLEKPAEKILAEVRAGEVGVGEHEHEITHLPPNARISTVLGVLAGRSGPGVPFFSSALMARRRRKHDELTFAIHAYPASATFLRHGTVGATVTSFARGGPADQYGVGAHDHGTLKFFDTIAEAMDACEAWDVPVIGEARDSCACAPKKTRSRRPAARRKFARAP